MGNNIGIDFGHSDMAVPCRDDWEPNMKYYGFFDVEEILKNIIDAIP